MSQPLKKTVAKTITRHSMLEAGDIALVALSGGADSVCLLNVLNELRKKLSFGLCGAYFYHQLRPEAAAGDEEFARKMAAGKGLAFVASSGDVRGFAAEQKLSIEDAARRLRYQFLLRSAIALGANKVATGHHADDQAETVIMRLIRGSAPQGLSGIPPVRQLIGGDAGSPQIIRPLIDVWRSDIMSYIRSNKLKYREDESNESPEYLRNRIRLQLLPMLEEEYNPQIKRRLASAASALALENEFIEAESSLLAGEVVVERKPGWVRFDASLLAAFHPALRKRVFSELAFSARRDAGMLQSLHYEEAESLLRSGRGRLDLPGGLRLEISEGAGLISEISKTSVKSRKTYEIAIDGATLIPELGIKIKTTPMTGIKSPARLAGMCSPNRQYFDLDALRIPLEIRFRRPGDAFRPLGARGSKKLKDFFIDKKVPRFLRDRVPLLISNGKIAWAMGYAIDNAYRLKPGSTAALRVDYE